MRMRITLTRTKLTKHRVNNNIANIINGGYYGSHGRRPTIQKFPLWRGGILPIPPCDIVLKVFPKEHSHFHTGINFFSYSLILICNAFPFQVSLNCKCIFQCLIILSVLCLAVRGNYQIYSIRAINVTNLWARNMQIYTKSETQIKQI